MISIDPSFEIVAIIIIIDPVSLCTEETDFVISVSDVEPIISTSIVSDVEV